MQALLEDEDKRSNGRRADSVDYIICTERISRCVERKHVGRSGSRRILGRIKKKFGKGDEEAMKVAELKRIEQEGRTMEEFIQKFKRAARGSRYEGRPLIEEFKREMSGAIRRKLMEAERPLTSIEQWYKCATNLDRH